MIWDTPALCYLGTKLPTCPPVEPPPVGVRQLYLPGWHRKNPSTLLSASFWMTYSLMKRAYPMILTMLPSFVWHDANSSAISSCPRNLLASFMSTLQNPIMPGWLPDQQMILSHSNPSWKRRSIYADRWLITSRDTSTSLTP